MRNFRAVCTNFSRKRVDAASSSNDIETLGHISRVLSANETALDLVSLHVEVSALVSSALAVAEDYNCEAVGASGTHWNVCVVMVPR
jgi:mediator of RNA polymerase II transcription subunit 5